MIKVNEKRKEAKKKPSIYKRNAYFFRVQNIPSKESFKRNLPKIISSHEDEAIESHFRTFL